MAAPRPAAPPTPAAEAGPTARGQRRSFYLFAALFLVIVALVLVILAAGVMNGAGERQFELSITPSGGAIGPGERLDVEINISSLRQGLPFFEHDLPVSLRAENVPSGVYVTFTPPAGVPDPRFISHMLVAHAGAPAGAYTFTVRATGTDGRNLSLPFKLQVIGAAPTTATR